MPLQVLESTATSAREQEASVLARLMVGLAWTVGRVSTPAASHTTWRPAAWLEAAVCRASLQREWGLCSALGPVTGRLTCSHF